MNERCLLYTSDAADERSSVDLGGRRIIKKKHNNKRTGQPTDITIIHMTRGARKSNYKDDTAV